MKQKVVHLQNLV